MGLFVMKFSLNKLQRAKQKDAAILQAWRVNSFTTNPEEEKPVSKNFKLPFYSSKTTNKNNNPYGAYM